MAKDTFYFPHDYTASNNPKIKAMIAEYKAEGYGMYWYIIELMHQSEDHKLAQKKYTYSAIAQQMSTNAEQVLKFISDCINEYELFEQEGGFFYADRVNRNVEKRQEISEKRALSGKKSAERRAALSTSVEQVSTSVQQNPTKERKGKERKVNTIVLTAMPLLSEVVLYFDDKGYTEASARRAYEYYSNLSWHNKDGKPILNWKNTMLNNWFKPENLKPNEAFKNNGTVKIDHRKAAESWK